MSSTKVAAPNPSTVERINCPLCGAGGTAPWGSENGYECVRCTGCGLLYVNPRPRADKIDEGVTLGVHTEEKFQLNVVGQRAQWKVNKFRAVLEKLYPDFKTRTKPIRWLDIGAGFGEFVEAVKLVAPAGSVVEGIEPMKPKAEDAQKRGLPIRAVYMSEVKETYDAVSLIDVFSHIPDFRAFLKDLKRLLAPGGELFIKTGNGADVGPRGRLPGPLTLPDHLVFAGQEHLRRYLADGGFEIVSMRAYRVDGFIYSARNVVKWVLRYPVRLGLPYTSPNRALYIRARLKSAT